LVTIFIKRYSRLSSKTSFSDALYFEILLPHLKFRNGIHLGDVTIDSGHIHSDGVKIFRTPRILRQAGR